MVAGEADFCVKCGEEEWGLPTLTCCRKKSTCSVSRPTLGTVPDVQTVSKPCSSYCSKGSIHNSVIFTG